ncbi:transporter substrate-binding domain-containing protein [Caballeronia sp. BR00000012568055]|jgi:polar amino acid transport system substrate-binding protein|uniref:transporter substrate-binding domain-containing protein n=1 Tax=Caballeronia sp. BR00000012568055 TaxID=2918761 RepID=UPI0023F9627D|nr:transporter substrate-binding domain-containing protein [Caballeronia sp. BR00000012568055]
MQFKSVIAGMVALTSIAFSITPAQADQLADVKSRGTLNCGVYSNVEPFSFPNPNTRQLEGMDVDLCNAIAKQMGVKVALQPLAVEARIPQLKLGRVDIVVANLAYTKTRATQVAFSDAYYSTKEVLVVKKEDANKKLADFTGLKISAADGSTSAQSIPLSIKNGQAVTFHDTSSAFLALQQGKVKGFVTNQMTATKISKQVQGTDGAVAIASEPMLIEPIAVGLKLDEPNMLAAVNKTLNALEQSGEMSAIFNKWLGPNTEFGLTRTDKVTPISQLKFTPVS